MAKKIHYELFVRYGIRGGYGLHDAITDRKEALRAAEAMLKEPSVTGVKVMKETFDEDSGEFYSIKIFEEGEAVPEPKRPKKGVEDEEPPTIPCFRPEDLYSVHARATMTRILSDSLGRWKITVTELIHRADALERFEATGTLFQHALQKVAVAQSQSSDKTVVQIMKALMDLATRAIHQVYRDEREGRLLPAGDVAAVIARAEALADEGGADYLFKASFAKYLAPAETWSDKLSRILEVSRALPEAAAPRKLIIDAIDVLVSEIVAGGAALGELLGERESLGAALLAMVDLVLGRAGEDGSRGLAQLAAEFKAGRLGAARRAIANRVLAELRGMKRLEPQSLDDEVKTLRQMAGRMVMIDRAIVPQEDIVTVFAVRSSRLVTAEAVEEFLKPAREPLARLERMLQLEENVIGGENKRRLVSYLLPALTAHQTESFVLSAPVDPLEKMKRLVALQRRVMRSSLQELEKRQVSEAVDALALKLEAKARVIEQSAPRGAPPVVRALTFLKLFGEGAITEGTLAARVRKEISAGTRHPAFVDTFVKQSQASREDALLELREALATAGVELAA
ncbi:MAG: hypothetical protein GC199_02815 [Alphaproteobacteria bacterium]|nr:hypothetical protein [Alphaproteobacteria bacterium]